MGTTPFRLAVAAVAAALLLAGCGMSARRTASMKNEANRAEISALRQENEVLKRNLAETLKEVEAVQRSLEAQRAEQRRFREMMATNFDLLEQSVALSLSKTMGQQPVVEPNELKLPPASTAPQGGTAGRPRDLPPDAAASGDDAAASEPEAVPADGAGQEQAMPQDEPSAASAAGSPRGDGGARARAVAMVKGSGAAKAGEPFTGEDPDLTPPAAPRRLTSHREAKALYDRGFTHFAHKEYDRAVLVYRDFLARFPEDTYSDNAQFWIGESYFRRQRYGEAEAAYREVLRNFEHRSSLEGYKTPESIYRIGQTYLKRNDPDRARFYFSAAAERFPDTSAGRKARHELASLTVKTAGAEGSRPPGS